MAALQEDRKSQRTSRFYLGQKLFLPTTDAFSIQNTYIFRFYFLYKIDTPPSILCFYFPVCLNFFPKEKPGQWVL